MPYIRITKDFGKNFIAPLSLVTNRAVLEINGNKITAVANASDHSTVFYAEHEIDTDLADGTTINIGDLTKLKNHLMNVVDVDDCDKLILDHNMLKYESKKWRFTIHLMDDSIITRQVISVDSLRKFEYATEFVLKPEAIREIIRIKSANKDAEKVYFTYTPEGVVYADVTDYSIANTDKTGVMVAEEFDGDINMVGCPLVFGTINLISRNRGVEFTVKYASRGVFLIQTVVDGCSLNYISSELKN